MMEEESAAGVWKKNVMQECCQSLAPQRDYCFILTSMPHIIKLILRNLEICDLLRCKLVCSVWEDIVNEITRGKIYLLTIDISFRYIQRAVEDPEIILRCLKLPSNKDINFITEISDNILPICSICYQYGDFPPFPSAPDNFLFYNIAIFPTLPGVQMLRFFYPISEARRTERCGISSVMERVPEEDLKCVIWFSSMDIEFGLRNRDYAVAGIPAITSEDYINFGFVFHGNRIKAALMNLYEKSIFHADKSLHPSFTERHIQALQRYRIDQSKCIAFVFSRYHKQCCENHTLLLFRQSFPDVPVIFYRCILHYGYDFMPGMNEYVPEKKDNFIAATLVLVWYD